MNIKQTRKLLLHLPFKKIVLDKGLVEFHAPEGKRYVYNKSRTISFYDEGIPRIWVGKIKMARKAQFFRLEKDHESECEAYTQGPDPYPVWGEG